MASNTLTDPDQYDFENQMAYANALRKRSMDAGGEMVSGHYVSKNPWLNFVEGLTGSMMGSRALEGQRQLGDRRQKEFDAFMDARPSLYNEFEGQQATPEQQFGPTQAPAVKQKALKSAAQMLEDQQNWIARPGGESNPLIQSVRQQAMLKGIDWPEKMLTQEGTLQLGRDKIAADAQNRKDQRDFIGNQNDLNRQSREDMIRLTASLRPPPAPHYPPTQMTDQGLLERQPDGSWKQVKVGDAVAGKPFAPTNALKNLPVKAQTEWSALQNLDSATKAYEALLKDYDPQGKDVLNVEKRNAVKAAFTDLQMRQKEAFGLGAITGPDMQILEGAYTDPTGVAGMLKGGLTGTKAFTAQIDQGRAALNRTKRNFEQQYKVELPDPAGTATAPMPGAGSGGFKILSVRDK